MFAMIEGAAILDKDRGDTLSEHIWGWFGIKSKPLGWKQRRWGLRRVPHMAPDSPQQV